MTELPGSAAPHSTEEPLDGVARTLNSQNDSAVKPVTVCAPAGRARLLQAYV